MDLLQYEPLVHALDLQHRPLVYESKTTLEGLCPAPLMISMQ